MRFGSGMVVVCFGLLTSGVVIFADGKKGYLTQGRPMALRLAKQVKPRITMLPALQIKLDPQPVFSTNFASPTLSIPKAKLETQTINKTVKAMEISEVMSKVDEKAVGKVPLDSNIIIDDGVIRPSALVEFFRAGKEGRMFIYTPLPGFRPPPANQDAVPRQFRNKSSSTYIGPRSTVTSGSP